MSASNKKLTSLLAAMALLAIAAGPAAAATINFGSLSSFDGPGGLDLSADVGYEFTYAVKTRAGDETVSGVTFTQVSATAGVSATGSSVSNYFSTSFGDTADDNALEAIMDDICYGSGNSTITIDATIVSGETYKLQLLFTGNSTTRKFDIDIEGSTAVTAFVITDYCSGDLTEGVVFTYEFTASDTNLDIDLVANYSQTPIWGAMTLERIPEPGTLVLLGMGSLGLLLRRRRR